MGDQRVAEGPPGDDGLCPWCHCPVDHGYGLAGGGMGEYWDCRHDICDYHFMIQDPDIPIESMPPHGVCFDAQGRAGRWTLIPDHVAPEYVKGLRGAVILVKAMLGVDAHAVDRIAHHVGEVADMLEAAMTKPDDEEDDHVEQDPQAG